MNWPVIRLLITLIVILFGSLTLAVYSIIRLTNYLNYYAELSNRYGLLLTRMEEIIEEYDNTSRNVHDQTYAEIVETVIHI